MAFMNSRWFLLFGIVALVLAVGRIVWVEREKDQLNAAYQDAQQTLAQLEAERARLNTELTEARSTIQVQATDLSGFQDELNTLQHRLTQTISELTALQREHASVVTQKQQLEARLSSIKELKLAIRDVKQRLWNERWAAWRAHVEAQKVVDQQRLASGNRGYVVHQGTSTLGLSAGLHVLVHEPEVQ